MTSMLRCSGYGLKNRLKIWKDLVWLSWLGEHPKCSTKLLLFNIKALRAIHLLLNANTISRISNVQLIQHFHILQNWHFIQLGQNRISITKNEVEKWFWAKCTHSWGDWFRKITARCLPICKSIFTHNFYSL